MGEQGQDRDPAGLEHLRMERDAAGNGGVALLTLDLPERRNAMSEEMTRSWGRAIAEVRADPSVRAVVVTGAGRAFCAGGDLSWLGAEPDASVADLRERMLAFYRTWLSITELEVPTIAAINGPAVGAGLALALACDLRYVAAEARVSVPFAALGLHPGMATTFLLRRAAGDTVARELLLTGAAITGADAAACGLATRAVPAEAVLATALQAASAVATAAPIAIRLTKAGLGPGSPGSLAEAIAWDGLAQPITLATRDLQEGVLAAREHRPPRFSGR